MASYYRDLIVWQKAFFLTEKIYLYTRDFPKEELYSLVDQMKRAAVSIVSNIAEGSGRGTIPDYSRFLNISKGSASELETQILLSEKLGFLSLEKSNELQGLIEEILKMLVSMISKFK